MKKPCANCPFRPRTFTPLRPDCVGAMLDDRVRDAHPTLHLYVENAMDPRFQKHLERYGFAVVKPRLDPPCYFLPAKGSP